MADDKKCTRCGVIVPPLYGPPPPGRERWSRNGIRMDSKVIHHVLRFRMFKLRWLPENPQDQLTESYTTLDLCDRCAGDVFLFAQGQEPRPAPAVPGATTTEGDRRG